MNNNTVRNKHLHVQYMYNMILFVDVVRFNVLVYMQVLCIPGSAASTAEWRVAYVTCHVLRSADVTCLCSHWR